MIQDISWLVFVVYAPLYCTTYLSLAIVQLVEDALVQHVLPSRYGGALPNLW